MTADDYPTLVSLDAHIAAEVHQLRLYKRRLATLVRPTSIEWRLDAAEINICIEVTEALIDQLLDLRLIKSGVAA
jgi:hypothetical protein